MSRNRIFEKKKSGLELLLSMLFCCAEMIGLPVLKSPVNRVEIDVSVGCSAQAGCEVLWCIFSCSCLETDWMSRSCLAGLAAHVAKGEPAQDQHQLLTVARVKVYSDTQNLVKDWL